MNGIETIWTSDGGVPAFEIFEPSVPRVPFVFCSPHSGSAYPKDFLSASRLKGAAIRKSEDIFVDRLFAFATELGAPLIAARFPRAYLDVNREPYELDPDMFDGPLPAFVNAGSMRVASGLGTIPRIVAEREEIYRRRLSPTEGMARIGRIYQPFHASLSSLLARTMRQFGMAILIDCHSMPSNVRALPGGRRPDIVVGDRFGGSADGRLVMVACEHLARRGWAITRNKPYAGGYITERYGCPSANRHAIQIEINRALYADEARLEPHDGYDSFAAALREAFAGFTAEVSREISLPAAAE